MNPKATWLWTFAAVVLFAFIFLFEKHIHPPPTGPARILPTLDVAAVNRIQILPKNQLDICAVRSNGLWLLIRPCLSPAQSTKINTLLSSLQNLVPATAPITAQELKAIKQANEKYGFQPPQQTLVLKHGNDQLVLHVGKRTAPGDQVFLQVVGIGEAYVVDADFLKLIPDQAADWRDPQLLDLARINFNTLLVTNAGKSFALQRNPANNLWRMILPGWEPRADSEKVDQALQRLQNLRAEEFVSDDPKADLDSFGLQTPELTLALAYDTEPALVLHFGKSPTNNPALIYAKIDQQHSVITVSKNTLGAWSHDGFRDRHLVTLASSPDSIQITADDQFILQHQTNGSWRVLPQDFPADTALVQQLLARLSELQALEIVQDTLIAPDLPARGLDAPVRQFVFRAALTNDSGTLTNFVLEQLDFGATQNDKIFARRTDESSLYTVPLAEVARLPSLSWQLRDRRIWNFTENDVARIVIRQHGKTREIERQDANDWQLAPGSSGIINDLAMDEVAHQLGQLTAAWWVARGDTNRALCGFDTNDHQITVELKSGRKLTVQFGATAASGFPYAITTIGDEPWIFEFPFPLFYQFVNPYLTIPAYIP